MDAQIITFDTEHVDAILSGEKTMTMRPAREGRPAKAGDLAVFVTPDDTPFAAARVTRVGKANGETVAEAEFEGHESYQSVSHLRERMADYYDYDINGNTDFFLVWFETYSSLSAEP